MMVDGDELTKNIMLGFAVPAHLNCEPGTIGCSTYSWFSDATVDHLVDTMNDTTDAPKRAAEIQQIYQIINDKAAIIPLWATDTIFVTRDDVAWTPTPNATWPVLETMKKGGPLSH